MIHLFARIDIHHRIGVLRRAGILAHILAATIGLEEPARGFGQVIALGVGGEDAMLHVLAVAFDGGAEERGRVAVAAHELGCRREGQIHQIVEDENLVNLTFAPAAKFVRRYGDAAALFRSAIEGYREDVEHRVFPSDAESYHLPEAARRFFQADRGGENVREDAGAAENADAVVNIDAREEMNQG